MRLQRATVVGITQASSISDGGGVLKAHDTNGDGRGGAQRAVVVDLATDQHNALRNAERKARTYGKALVGLVSLLCLSVCGNIASSALSILVFKESRISAGEVLSDHEQGVVATAQARLPLHVVTAMSPVKKCAIAPRGMEACWELADPTMTDIPDDFLLYHNTDLAGTLKVGASVTTIGHAAFANTKFTSLDLSGATSLVSIGESAFYATALKSTLVIPAKVTTIGDDAFAYTMLEGLDLSKASSLASIGVKAFYGTAIVGMIQVPASFTATTIHPNAFPSGVTTWTGICHVPKGSETCETIADRDGTGDDTVTDIARDFMMDNTDLTGTLKVGFGVHTIGHAAFASTKLTRLDLSEATALVSIGEYAFGDSTDLEGKLVIPSTVTTIGAYAFYNTKRTGLDLSKAPSLVSIGDYAFVGLHRHDVRRPYSAPRQS